MNPEPRYFGGGISINGRMEYLSPNERELESLIDDLEWESLVEKYEKIIRLLDGTWNKGGMSRLRIFGDSLNFATIWST